jgi:Family of unknown function (DUF6411)
MRMLPTGASDVRGVEGGGSIRRRLDPEVPVLATSTEGSPAVFIVGVVAICVFLFLLALLAPRVSRGPQRAVDRGFGGGARAASHAPGPLGRWLPKPFRSSQRAADKSAAAGRKAHRKVS